MKTQYKIGVDKNGNQTLRVRLLGERGFSIQTNGNLPETHRRGVCDVTPHEVMSYIGRHGTTRQLAILMVGGGE